MSLSGAHRAAFRREAPGAGLVFSIRDEGGFPIVRDAGGTRAMPFWSRSSRAAKVVAQVPAYRGFAVVEIGVRDWLHRWLPGLERDGVLVGVNWAGPRATGYDLPVAQVADWFAELS